MREHNETTHASKTPGPADTGRYGAPLPLWEQHRVESCSGPVAVCCRVVTADVDQAPTMATSAGSESEGEPFPEIK
jgi:hypothetical protein